MIADYFLPYWLLAQVVYALVNSLIGLELFILNQLVGPECAFGPKTSQRIGHIVSWFLCLFMVLLAPKSWWVESLPVTFSLMDLAALYIFIANWIFIWSPTKSEYWSKQTEVISRTGIQAFVLIWFKPGLSFTIFWQYMMILIALLIPYIPTSLGSNLIVAVWTVYMASSIDAWSIYATKWAPYISVGSNVIGASIVLVTTCLFYNMLAAPCFRQDGVYDDTNNGCADDDDDDQQ